MNKLVKHIVEQKFNFNIDQLDIEDNEGDFSLSTQQYKSKSMKQEYIDNNLFVDLCLPSETLWCKYNLGCDFELLYFNPDDTKPSDWYGNYYAWGETKDKDEYTWKSYEYAINDELTKYCTNPNYGYNGFADGLSELLHKDDVAYQTNSGYRIPTREQCRELINYTNNRWISGKNNDLYMNVEGLRGRLFTSKINRNQIFIPAAGWKSRSSLDYDGSYCYLWSSSLRTDDPDYAWSLSFNSSYSGMGSGDRFSGQNVRSVLNKNN